jgi:hypothetical protein
LRATIASKPFLLPLLLIVVFLGAACRGGGTAEEPQSQQEGAETRSFEMGLSSLPQEPSQAGYEDAFHLAGGNGDLILIQRAPPWDEFRPGGVISAATVDLTREEKRLADENGLKIFAAVDPLDPADRGRLASPPEDLADAGFGDARVRSAFIAYAQYLALNLRPRYMALGMEVDLYEAARPDDFDNFVSLYFEAYDAVKDISPETLVFPTFQMEAIQNLLSPAGQPAVPGTLTRWHLVLDFEPKVDILAVTTYPSFVFATPDDIPPDYYDQLRLYSDAPIAIAAAGYSSGPGREGINEGTEQEQEAFLSRLFQDAQRLDMTFVVWFASTDLPYVPEPPLDLLQYIGLRRADGSAKPAWEVWAQEAAKPLAPAGQQ